MTTHRIPRLAVTGGIGSGKSTASAYLRELGAAAVSADDLVHRLLETPDVVALVQERFGDDVVGGSGIDRGALAGVVFDDPQELIWLENLLHPQVRLAIEEWAAAQEALPEPPPLLVGEIPLLFETGMEREFDYVLLITAPEEVRRKRLVAKLTESEFSRRVANQLDETAKVARSDFVFVNAGSRRRLREYVAEVYGRVVAEHAATGGAENDEA